MLTADLDAHNAARGRLYGLIDLLRRRKIAPVSTREFSAVGFKARLDFCNKFFGTKHEYLNDVPYREVDSMSDRLKEYFGL
jgi:hypothetical protein